MSLLDTLATAVLLALIVVAANFSTPRELRAAS